MKFSAKIFDRLNVWFDGYENPIGQLNQYEDESLGFEYQKDYVARPEAVPISLSLPLAGIKFGDFQTRTFFGNLIPEGGQAYTLSGHFRIPSNDVFAFLQRMGTDCAGALTCLPTGKRPASMTSKLSEDYVPLGEPRLAAAVRRLQEGISTDEDLISKTLLSGTQEKIGLVYDGQERKFLIPKRGSYAPTTHILKVPRNTSSSIAAAEFNLLKLARKLGLKVVNSELMNIGGIDVLLVQRFDRRMDNDGCVRRIHQEDIAQACGLPSPLKYERYGLGDRKFTADKFREVLAQTYTAEAYLKEVFLLTVFNLAVGNTDYHAKNHALIYGQNVAPELAPAYDLVPTDFASGVTPELAFKIGRASQFEDIRRTDWLSLAGSLGFNSLDQVDELFEGPLQSLLVAIERSGETHIGPELSRFGIDVKQRCRVIRQQLYR